jgi:hypothetical protein
MAQVRCRACGAGNPAGFTFCLACGRRVWGNRLWPRSPEPLPRSEIGRGCPVCEAPLTDAIALEITDDQAPATAPSRDVVIRGSEPDAPGLTPSHECRQCGRQYWVVRSRWEGWTLQIAWRAVRLWQGITQR